MAITLLLPPLSAENIVTLAPGLEKHISLPFLFMRVPRTGGYMLFVGFQVNLDQSMKQLKFLCDTLPSPLPFRLLFILMPGPSCYLKEEQGRTASEFSLMSSITLYKANLLLDNPRYQVFGTSWWTNPHCVVNKHSSMVCWPPQVSLPYGGLVL